MKRELLEDDLSCQRPNFDETEKKKLMLIDIENRFVREDPKFVEMRADFRNYLAK